MEDEEVEAQRAMNNNVMCQLTVPEGTPLGPPMYLPQNAGPKELQQMVNKLLNNEEKLPYAFYISDQELFVELGMYLQKNKVSVEKVLTIVYQPQAVFRIRPVNRCSATIAGHTEAVLSVSFSPDGRQLASGSGDTTVRLWDLNTQTPMFTCTGHKNWVLCIAWSPDGKHLVSGSKAGELQCWDPQMGKPSGNPLINAGSENQVSSTTVLEFRGLLLKITEAIEDVTTTLLIDGTLVHDLRTFRVPFTAGSINSA